MTYLESSGYDSVMAKHLGSPGALLILLRRDVTSTRVLVRSGDATEVPFARAEARAGVGQRQLAAELCEVTWANEVSRLYASTLSVMVDDARLGLFVGFLDGDADDAPPPPQHAWHDLREAADALPEPWGGLLAAVRRDFIAQSPDDALRVS